VNTFRQFGNAATRGSMTARGLGNPARIKPEPATGSFSAKDSDDQDTSIRGETVWKNKTSSPLKW
jgi:hypothetical protein